MDGFFFISKRRKFAFGSGEMKNQCREAAGFLLIAQEPQNGIRAANPEINYFHYEEENPRSKIVIIILFESL